jgi:hypothetical protein
MKILLVYELIPEDTKFYVFENVHPGSELHKHLLGAHGHYANFDGPIGDNESTDFLCGYLVTETKANLADIPYAGPFDVVVHSGFGM